MRYALTLVPVLATAAVAQSSIDPSNAVAWAENAGYLNFDAASGGDHVAFTETSVTGWVWGENIGWINLGRGPSDGVRYQNLNAADCGVNVHANGALYGYSWGENVGWINFGGGAGATPSNPARIDAANQRLRGYAWGENIGWINLDDAAKFVGLIPALCPADFNQDGGIDGADVQAFFAAWESGEFAADVNADGGIDGADVEAFFAAWEAGGC